MSIKSFLRAFRFAWEHRKENSANVYIQRPTKVVAWQISHSNWVESQFWPDFFRNQVELPDKEIGAIVYDKQYQALFYTKCDGRQIIPWGSWILREEDEKEDFSVVPDYYFIKKYRACI